MLEPFNPSVRLRNEDPGELTLASAARPESVSQAVVIPHGPAGRIAPPVLACGLFRVAGIEDTVLGLARLADHEQTYFACAVVEEAVAQACTGRESHCI